MVDQKTIHNQCLSDDPEERINALEQLSDFFSSIPDKQLAWNDLHKLTNDKNRNVRAFAALTLGYAFSYVPDKQQAWNNLFRLTNDEFSTLRVIAADALGSAFSQVPDKEQAWNDLHRLTNDKDNSIRATAAKALGSAFSQVPDKEQAWNDLHRLINNEEWNVRSGAADALGSVYSQVPDKLQAWNDLHRLTNDRNSEVRTYVNYSLGRISIFKASHANKEEDYKNELEKAICFFEKAGQESHAKLINPSKFCLPFYRSFHIIVFKKQEATEVVNRYLEEAKAAIGSSTSKKLLIEAVENLAKALKEVQNLGNMDLQGMKGELDFYRNYCECAEELLRDTDEKAPFATRVLKKGLPIFDKNLKKLIEEIQEKARTTYKESIGTDVEETAFAVFKEVHKWVIGNPEEMNWYVNNIVVVLKSKIPHNTENKEILDMIESMKIEKDLTKQYRTLSIAIGLIPKVNVVAVDPILDTINKVGQNIETKLDCISQEIKGIRISFNLGIKQEIEISTGIETFGTGAKLITTIPLQEISYAEIKEDLQRIKGEPINKLSQLPKRLANKIKGYLLLKDREDIVDKLN